MKRKKKRTAVRAALWYALFTIGSWMFINSYANSYNRLTGEKIAAASLEINGETAEIGVLEHSLRLDLSGLSSDSKLYCAAYLMSPDEVRAAAYVISAAEKQGLFRLNT